MKTTLGKFVFALVIVSALAACGKKDGQPGAAQPAQGQAASARKIALVAGNRDDYTVARAGAAITVTNKATKAVTTHEGVDAVQFADKVVSFELDGAPGKVYRLYRAAFNRKADEAGLGFWINAFEHGVDLNRMATEFSGSDEYKKLFGDMPSNEQFLTRLYQNVLRREPDQKGYQWWLGAMKQDATLTQARMLAQFADGPENKAAVQAELADGITYVPVKKPAAPAASAAPAPGK